MLFLHDIYHIIRMEQDNLYNLLQSIDTPDDLRHLSADKLPEVCKELRQKIIDELSCNPGHPGVRLKFYARKLDALHPIQCGHKAC